MALSTLKIAWLWGLLWFNINFMIFFSVSLISTIIPTGKLWILSQRMERVCLPHYIGYVRIFSLFGLNTKSWKSSASSSHSISKKLSFPFLPSPLPFPPLSFLLETVLLRLLWRNSKDIFSRKCASYSSGEGRRKEVLTFLQRRRRGQSRERPFRWRALPHRFQTWLSEQGFLPCFMHHRR